MKQDCLDIGTIQAFLDGELASPERNGVSSHIAGCENCAFMLAEAEDETAIVFPVLEREFNTLVPTQRLWTRINSAIEIEKSQAPFWEKAWAVVAAALASPSFVAAAGLLVVVGIFASVWLIRTPVSDDPFVGGPSPRTTIATTTGSFLPPRGIEPPVGPRGIRLEPASYSSSRRISAQPAAYRVPNLSNGYMPGEESYVKTISSLSQTVEGKKDGILRPGQRVAYERDLAVVNDSITKMKKEVQRNPRNDTARQALYSSYQNKIDLLNSVAQKEELMASIK
jgi:anti-sigma factor RsiW